jgi:hypothetical protein
MISSKWIGRALGAALLVSIGSVSGCQCGDPPEGPPTLIKELSVRKVDVDLAVPEPEAPFWKKVPTGIIKLEAQPMVAPRPEATNTGEVLVQAAHDGKNLALRLRWKDPEKSEAGPLGAYSDALAIQFPVKPGAPPPIMMGGKGQPVHIFHWRAQYQRDAEKGKPEMAELYPHMSVDMYPHEFKTTDAGAPSSRETYSPGKAMGNPQSYAKKGVDEIVAEGFSTSSVQEGHGSAAKGAWANGEWTLVIVRPLAVEGGSTLSTNDKSNIAFAVWQGGKGEVGSRKSVTMTWTPVVVQ